MHPVLVKLGGSVITNKQEEARFDRETAGNLLAELSASQGPFVLLHGAGSFGHPIVEKYVGGDGVGKKIDDTAADSVLESVLELHSLVMAEAEPLGLNPVSIPMGRALRSNQGALTGVPLQDVVSALRRGQTPVLHGTMARSKASGWEVVSADQLMVSLAAGIEPVLSVFVTDVDGVLDANGDLIPELSSAQGISSQTTGTDVTGAMRGKVLEALKVAKFCPTLICNGTIPGRLTDALAGRDLPCTRIVPP